MMNICKVLGLGIPVGFLFEFLQVPLPWTLGPIVAVSLYSWKTGQRIYWPLKIRDTALILLGYAMGRPFTIETGHKIIDQLPMMLCATLITVFAGVVIGYITHKKTNISLTTCLLGCVPGGLSQMVVLAGEMDGTDQTAVTIMQTIRMLSVVFVIPFLTMHVLHDGNLSMAEAAANMPAASLTTIFVFSCVAIGGAVLGRIVHLPTAYLLGPILSTGFYILLTGAEAPIVPISYISIAQICVGSYIGSSINLAKIKQYHGLLSCLFSGVGVVLLISLLMGYIVAELTGVAFVTAFLSTAPGGLTEMGITALLVGADISTMTAYQLVRLLFIMLAFPYIAQVFVMLFDKKVTV